MKTEQNGPICHIIAIVSLLQQSSTPITPSLPSSGKSHWRGQDDKYFIRINREKRKEIGIHLLFHTLLME